MFERQQNDGEFLKHVASVYVEVVSEQPHRNILRHLATHTKDTSQYCGEKILNVSTRRVDQEECELKLRSKSFV